jgi:hypothetical protein
MKTRQQFTDSNRKRGHRHQPEGQAKSGTLSLFFRFLSRSWVINALVVPLLISLFSVIVSVLLSHWGK